MRIDKVEIDGFGKLNNCSYTFSDGVNLIYGKNESGKSTLCEFILAMFYGMPNESKKLSEEISVRRKYRPWNSENFGGRVYFTDDKGKKLILERSFKATKRGDKAVLRDADTWEETGVAEDIGEKYFGLSREAFLKTLYVKSFGADNIKKDDGEIMSRLSNIETSGDEDLSYSKILNAIEKDTYILKTKTGKGGKIPAIEEQIAALNNERSISAMTYSVLDADSEAAENLKRVAEEKENDAKLLEDKYAIALQNEKYMSQKKIKDTKEMLEKRIEAQKEKRESLKAQLDDLENCKDTTVSAEEISRARVLETKKLLATEKLEVLKKAEKFPKKSNGLWVAIGVAIIGVVLAIFGLILNIAISVSGIILALIGIATIVLKKSKLSKEKEEKNNEELEIRKEIDAIAKELDEIFAPFGVSISEQLASVYMSSQNKEKQKEELRIKYFECEKEIESLKQSMPQESEKEEYSNEAVEYKGESAGSLFEKINLLKSESRQMAERAHEILMHIAKETAEIRTEEEIERDLKEAEEEKKELIKRHNALLKATEWLTLAQSEIKNNFAPRLNKKASSILSYLTQEKYEDIRSNDNFHINLKSASGEIVEAGFMSRGTYDLMYTALRFATMSVLADGKIPPVILDDAFSQLDDTRLLRAVDLIKNNNEFSQVLLFTCHENYKEILKNTNMIEL